MAINYTHVKKYGPFRGLNKGVSDLTLQEDFFSVAKNAFVLPGSTALTSRPGYKPVALDPFSDNRTIFCGLYIESDVDTGVQTERELILDLDAELAYTIDPATITIANATGDDIYVEVLFDTADNLWKCVVSQADDGTVISTTSLDSAAGTPSTTVTSLVATLTGLTDITATLNTSGAGSSYASMVLPALKVLVPNGASREIDGHYAKGVICPTAIFTEIESYYGTSEMTAISYTNASNCLYFAVPNLRLLKFDGVEVRQAGAPNTGASFSTFPLAAITSPTAGGIVTGQYVYAFTVEVRDTKNNVIESIGEVSRPLVNGFTSSGGTGPGYVDLLVGSSPANITLTVPSVNGDNIYSPRGAIKNGSYNITSSTRTLVVDSGHTIVAGDTICFTVQIGDVGAYAPHFALVTAPVESIGATTIVLATEGWTYTNIFTGPRPDIKTKTRLAAVFEEQVDITLAELDAYYTAGQVMSIADNAVISNNMRINIYRNKGAAATIGDDYPDLYLNSIIPNNAFASNFTYVDFLTDAALLVPMEQKLPLGPIPYGPYDGSPPMGLIVHNHQDRLYMAGDPEAPNVLYRSDPLFGVEFFNPNGTSELNLETKVASKITAIGSTSDNLVVGKTRGIKLLSGDLGTDNNIRIDDLSFELGLANQASTVSAVDRCIGLTQLGPIEITSGGQWNFLGSQDLGNKSRLEGVLKNGSFDLDFASATVNPEKGLFFLYLPTKGSMGSTTTANNSFLQFNQGAGLEANATFGSAYVYSITQDAWFEWTGLDATGGAYIKNGLLHTVRTGSIGSIILRESASGELSDFVDWFEGIEFDVATNWVTLGEPYLFKQFQRALIQNVETSSLSGEDFTLTLTTEKDWVGDTAHSSVNVAALGTVGYGQLKIKGNKSRAMRVRLQHSTAKKRPTISGLTLEVAAPFKPKVKQE